MEGRVEPRGFRIDQLRNDVDISGLELRELQVEGAVLFEVHDGKVTRLVLYRDGDRALADLGLKE